MKESKKAKQGKKNTLVGSLYNSEGLRDQYGQGGRNQKNDKVSGGMCTGIKTITKDIS